MGLHPQRHLGGAQLCEGQTALFPSLGFPPISLGCLSAQNPQKPTPVLWPLCRDAEPTASARGLTRRDHHATKGNFSPPPPLHLPQHPFRLQAGTQRVLAIQEGNKTLDMTLETYVCSLSPFLERRGNNSCEIGHHVTATLSPGLHS